MNSGAIKAVSTPASAIARLLMAPSISPISNAFAVPIAWEAEPMATPAANGSVIFKTLHSHRAVRLPVMPVRIITVPAKAPIPPRAIDTSTPIAVVIDFGKRVAV